MPSRQRLDPQLTSEPIRTSDYARWGVPPSRLRSDDVAHPFHGVNVAGPAPERVEDLVRAYVPLLRDGDAFSHATAAVLLGVPMPSSGSTLVHVTSTGGRDRPRRRGVVGHRSPFLPISWVSDVPVVAPAQLWMQLAAELERGPLVAAGDYLVTGPRDPDGGHSPLVGLAGLADALACSTGSRGVANAKRALPLVREGVDSSPETGLRLLLLDAGYPEPRIGFSVAVGRRMLHPDLAWPQLRIAFEYEGDGHRTDRWQWRHDIGRREDFEAGGWRIIRVTAQDLLPAGRRSLLDRVNRIVATRGERRS